MAPVLRALYAERHSGMPRDWHNERRDLLEKVERARHGEHAAAAQRAQALVDEADAWELGRVRPHREAVS